MNWLYLVLERWHLQQLGSDVNSLTTVNVVCFMTNVPWDPCLGIMVASFIWSNATFSLFINLDANFVQYWLRFPGLWLIHFFGGSSIRWTVSHTSFGLPEINSFHRKEAFFNVIVFFIMIYCTLVVLHRGQNCSNHAIWFVNYQGHF